MKKLTTEEFIYRAKSIHGDRYKYDNTIYSGYNNNLIITCDVHGDFNQSPHSHLSGNGCLLCNRTFNRLSQEEFLRRVKIASPNIIIASNYKKYKSKVIVEDRNGYMYRVSPSSLLSGFTPTIQTAANKNYTFELMSRVVHGDKYDYSKVKYLSTHRKVSIVCLKHGEFLQAPSKHLIGRGCPICALESTSEHNRNNPTGWTISNWIKAGSKSSGFTGYKVYILKCFDENEEFIKIGRTFQDISRRYAGVDSIKYNYEIIKEIHGSAHHMFKLENKLKRICKDNRYTPNKFFKGISECFTLDCLNLIKEYIDDNS